MRIQFPDSSRLATGVILALTAIAFMSDAAPAGQSTTVEITVEARKGFKFHPDRIEAPAGKKVMLTLENTTGVMGHNLRIPEFDVMTETITPGESDTVRFTAGDTGTYEFRCEVPGHAQAGMVGELIVQ